MHEVMCKHDIMHEADAPGLPLISFLERRIRWIGVLLSVTCVAYFYALDRIFFSSAHFSPIFRRLLTVEDLRAAWLGLAICVLAVVWMRPAPILRLVDSLGDHPYRWSLAERGGGVPGRAGRVPRVSLVDG